jgi:nucleoid DNA-binding protein
MEPQRKRCARAGRNMARGIVMKIPDDNTVTFSSKATSVKDNHSSMNLR